MKFKKVVAGVLCTALAAGMLAGCGGNAGGSSSDNDKERTIAAADSENQETYKVTMAYIGDAYEEAEPAVLEKVNKV